MKTIVLFATLNLIDEQQAKALINVSEVKTTERGINYLVIN